MKKITQLFVIMFILLMGYDGISQVASYTFSEQAGTFTPNPSSATIVSSVQTASGMSKSIPIGFNFVLGSKSYSNFKMSSKGYITFDTSVTSVNSSNNLSSANTSTTVYRPMIAPLWDDLSGALGIASYHLSGTAPNRVLTVEWLEWQWNNSSSGTTPTISFQVKLYETTNVIDFVYRQEAGTVSSGSASIGINDPVGSGAGSYLNLNSNLTPPTVTSTTSVTNINTKPATGQVFRFTPPACLYTGTISVSGITLNSATVNLSKPFNVPVDVYISNNGTVPSSTTTPNTTIPAGSTSGNLTGLSSSSFYKVYVKYTCLNLGWIEATDFRTPCGPITANFFEGFESTPIGGYNNNIVPDCWTYLTGSGSGYGYNYNSQPKTGLKAFYGYPYDGTLFYLISPEITDLGNGTKQLRFSARLSSNGASKLEIYRMNGKTATATKTLIQSFALTTSYVEYVLPLAATTDDYFAFGFKGGAGEYNTIYLDDIYYEDLAPCSFPLNLTASNITTTGVDLSWSTSLSSTATGYEYEIRTSGAPGSGTTGLVKSGTTTGTTASETGLIPGTTYYVYVRTICGTNPGPWSPVKQFMTLCAQVGNFFEGFESTAAGSYSIPSPPVCWTYLTGGTSGYGYTYQYDSKSGSKSFYTYTYGTEVLLISPETNSLGNGTKQIRFWAKMPYSSGNGYKFQIYTMNGNTPAATKTLLQTINLTSTWTEYIVPLPATSDSYFAFSSNLSSSGYMETYLDDIYYEDQTPCLFPMNISAGTITATTATISWSPSVAPTVTGYEYEIRTSGAPGSGATGLVKTGTVTGTSAPVTGLNPGTKYFVYVRSICGTTNGTWSGSNEFMTLCQVFTANFFEGFETTASGGYSNPSPPICWTYQQNGNSGAGYTYQYDSKSGSKSFYSYSYGSEILLISPETNSLGNGTKQIRFWAKMPYSYGSGYKFEIYTMNGNTAAATKTLVQAINLTSTWTEYIVPLPNTTDNYFAFSTNTSTSGSIDVIIDDINYEDISACIFPMGVNASNITVTSATISWNASLASGVTAYEYEVRTTGAAGSGSTGLVASGTVTGTSANITGLSGSSTYTVYVRSVCGTSKGQWTPTAYKFSTPCTVVTSGFFEGFENTDAGSWNNNTVPYCWTYAANVPQSGYGYTDPYNYRSGSKGFYAYRYNYLNNGVINPSYQGDVLLISPETDNLGKGTKRIRFWARLSFTPAYGSFEVYSMDGTSVSSNKTLLKTINLTSSWKEYVVYLPTNTTDDYFAFSFQNDKTTNGSQTVYLDDIYYEDMPNCVPIDNTFIKVTNIGKDNLKVSWTDNYNTSGVAYEVEVRSSGTPGTPGAEFKATTAVGATSIVATGLSALTKYNIYIRSVCSATDQSVWNEGVNVITLCSFPDLVSYTTSAVYCGPQKAKLDATLSDPTGIAGWYDKEDDEVSLFDGNNFVSKDDVTQSRSFWLRTKYVTDNKPVQIGEGTTTGTNTGMFLNYSYGGYKHQYIFTADELRASGLIAGDITALQFDVVKTGSKTRDNFTIAIGSTTQNVATTNMIQSLTQVYSGTPYQKFTTGIMTFTFTTPYKWDGKSNIVVQTNWSNEGASGTSGELRYHTTSVNRTATLYSNDNTAINLLNANTTNTVTTPYIYGTTTNTRPNTIFVGKHECKSPATEIPVTIEPKPLFELSADKVTSCEGGTTSVVTVATNQGGYDTFVWTPSTGVSGNAATGWTFSTTTEQLYTLVATQSTGICEVVKTVLVFAGTQPEANPNLAASFDVCKDVVTKLDLLKALPAQASIGAAKTTTAATLGMSAFVQSSVYSRQQFIYSAAELTAQGITGAGYISSLSFETTDAGASLSNPSYTLKMMLSPNTSFGNTSFYTGNFSTVYTKVNHTHSFQGVQTFIFDNAFYWDGQSNIVLEILQEGEGGGNNAKTYYSGVTGTNVGLYAGSATDANPLTGTLTVNRLNTVFGFKQAAVTWSPTNNLYLDAAATVPYTSGVDAPTVYTVSSTGGSQVYTATLTGANGCATTKAYTVNTVDVGILSVQDQVFCKAVPVTDVVVTGAPAASLSFYSSATSTTPITTISQNGTYYVEAKLGNCKSARIPFNASIVALALPSAQLTQVICGSGTIADLSARGANGAQIKWYSSATSTTPLPSTHVLTDNTTYYASQSSNGCESGRIGVLVDINPIPPALTPQTISLCGALNYGSVNLNQVTGSELVWYQSATSQQPIPNTDAVVSGTYYVSQKINGCESPRVPVNAAAQGSVAAPSATIQNMCGGGTVAQLVAQTLPNATAEWFSSATSTVPLAGTTPLLNGTYYLAQRIGNCMSVKVPVAVRVINTTAPVVSPFTLCEGSTVADLVIPAGTGITHKWYTSATSTTVLPSTAVLQSGFYFVERDQNGCTSGRTQVQVTIGTRPGSPTGNSPQSFDNYAEISNIAMDQPNVVWYLTFDDAIKGINALPQNMPLVDGATYYAVIIGANGCPSDPTAIQVIVKLGLNDFDLSRLKYYPNPVSDMLTVHYSEVITKVEVFDLNGRLVMTRNFDKPEVQLDFSALSAGTYMLNIQTKDNSQFVKVVKK